MATVNIAGSIRFQLKLHSEGVISCTCGGDGGKELNLYAYIDTQHVCEHIARALKQGRIIFELDAATGLEFPVYVWRNSAGPRVEARPVASGPEADRPVGVLTEAIRMVTAYTWGTPPPAELAAAVLQQLAREGWRLTNKLTREPTREVRRGSPRSRRMVTLEEQE